MCLPTSPGVSIVTFRERELAELAYNDMQKTAMGEKMVLYSGPGNKSPPEL